MTKIREEAGGATVGGPSSHYTHEHTARATIDIWMAVQAADEPLTLADIYDRVRKDLPDSWLSAVIAYRFYSHEDIAHVRVNLDDVALRYLRERVRGMTQRGHLVNVGTSDKGGGLYVAGRQPQEPNHLPYHRPTDTGWKDADLERRGASSDLHTARWNWHFDVERELAKPRPRGAVLRELLDRAQQLMPK